LVGYANCIDVDGTWKSRSSYINPDKPVFRTIGETVGDKGNVKADSIRCLGADFSTILSGTDNCYPYWLEGENIVIGKDLSGNEIKQDKFVWLTKEGIECGNDPSTGVKLTGPSTSGGKCKVKTRIPCNTSKLARLNISAESTSTCIPTLTWEAA
jgi:hypothetical protein